MVLKEPSIHMETSDFMLCTKINWMWIINLKPQRIFTTLGRDFFEKTKNIEYKNNFLLFDRHYKNAKAGHRP